MKYDIYFEEAKKVGLEALELYEVKSSNLSFSLFHGEIESYSVANSYSLTARGIYKGKFGYASTEKEDATAPKYLVDQIKVNASVNEAKENAEIFKGSEKYVTKNVYNASYLKVPTEKKIEIAKQMEKALKEADERIYEVEISYSEEENETKLINSYGVNLKSKTNILYYYVSAVATDENQETKTGYKIAFSNDFNDIDPDAIVKEVVENTLSQLGGKPCKSKKYKTILDKKVAASLLTFFLQSASSEAINKKSSLLINKLNEQVASKKVTLEERPLSKNIFFRGFDDEGVATMNKKIIEKGVLKTYFYDLKNARKDGVAPTGNGYKGGNGKAGVSFVNPYLKPGKYSLEELFNMVGDGIYITTVQGLHAGMNAQSGNFSLQASGYLIENGKKSSPVTLITIAGNLFEMLKDVKEVGSDSELLPSGFTCSSIYLKKLAISGE